MVHQQADKKSNNVSRFGILVDPVHIINQHNCVIIYGKNEEVAYSLFAEFSGSVVDLKDMKQINLLQNALVPESDLKIKATAKDIKELKEIFKQDIAAWQRKCIILLDKYVDIFTHHLVAEINCDSVNMNKFIEFHAKRLGYVFENINDLFWVRDLCDLHFAHKVAQIDPKAVSNMSAHEINQMNLVRDGSDESLCQFWSMMDNPWSWIRYLQYFYNYRNDSARFAMCKHLELWCYKYVPNDEVFIWLIRSILLRD